MILNALKVDPTVTWKEPWRWYTQGADPGGVFFFPFRNNELTVEKLG